VHKSELIICVCVHTNKRIYIITYMYIRAEWSMKNKEQFLNNKED